MTYQYFNSSMLAFGLNISNAFKSLSKQLDAAYDSINFDLDEIINNNESYSEKNYKVPMPLTVSSPCRCREVYDILAIQPLNVQNFLYNENGMLNIHIVLFNPKTLKLTNATGSLNLSQIKYPKGYALLNESIDNNNPDKTISFVQEKSLLNEDKILFRYRIDKTRNALILDELGSYFENYTYPSCYTSHYKDIKLIELSNGTSNGYCPILTVTDSNPQDWNYPTRLESQDNTYIANNERGGVANSTNVRICGINYCYPGEKVSLVDVPGKIYRIEYVSGKRGRTNA